MISTLQSTSEKGHSIFLQCAANSLDVLDLKACRQVCKLWRREVDSNLSFIPLRNTDKVGCLLSHFPALTGLSFRVFLSTSLSLMHDISTVPTLTTLTISGRYRIGDDLMGAVARNLTKLTSLAFEYCTTLTDEGTCHLSDLRLLQSLSLRGCAQIQGTHLAVLHAVPHIQVLDLGGCKSLSPVAVAAISNLTQITWLDLSECEALNRCTREAAEKLLASLPNLRYLNLCKCGLLQHLEGDDISKLSQLAHLNLGGAPFALAGGVLRAASQLPCLRRLSLEQLHGGLTFKQWLTSPLPKLKELVIDNTSVLLLQQPKGLVGSYDFQMLGEVTRLEVHHSWVRAERLLQAITQLPQLSDLTLVREMLCPEATPRLSTCKQLTALRLKWTSVLAAGCGAHSLPYAPPFEASQALQLIQCISQLPKLKVVDLTSFPLLGDCCRQLASLPSLAQLSVRYCPSVELREDDLKQLVHLKSVLRALDLSDTQVSDSALVSCLPELTALSSLKLASKHISDVTMEHMTGLSQLRELDLVWCNITDTGLSHLSHLTLLNSLELYHLRSISDEGMLSGLLPLTTHCLCYMFCHNLPRVSTAILPVLGSCHKRVDGSHFLRGPECT